MKEIFRTGERNIKFMHYILDFALVRLANILDKMIIIQKTVKKFKFYKRIIFSQELLELIKSENEKRESL